jgi:hypothetical protein
VIVRATVGKYSSTMVRKWVVKVFCKPTNKTHRLIGFKLTTRMVLVGITMVKESHSLGDGAHTGLSQMLLMDPYGAGICTPTFTPKNAKLCR